MLHLGFLAVLARGLKKVTILLISVLKLKVLNKLPLILLCTIMIVDNSFFDCRVLPQQGRDGAIGSDTTIPDPFGISLE